MSKQKRKPIQTKSEVPEPSRKSLKWIWIASTMGLAAIIVCYWFFLYRHAPAIPTKSKNSVTPEQTLDALSRSNFPGAEKPVIEKIRNLVAEVKSNNSSAHAWGKLAINLDAHDFKNEALICYGKAAALNATDYRWPYYQGVLLYDQGSSEALKYFEQSLNLKPNHLAARLRYGQALLDANRMEEAARQFVKALEIDPKSSHAYVGLARISFRQGQVKDCGSLLQKALQINPRHTEAYGLMAEVYRRLNQLKKANAQVLISQQLPKRTPFPDELEDDLLAEGVSSYWCEFRGRAALERGDLQSAERELKMAIQAAPDPRFYDTLGVVYLYERNYPEAVAAHRKALELNPKLTRAWNNLAAALFEMGKKEEAFDAVKKAIQVEPSFPYSYLHLGRLNIRAGNPAGAVQAYQLGLQQLPQNPDLAIQLSWLLATSPDASLRNGAQAVRLAEFAASRNPGAENLDVLASAYAETGQFDRAVQVSQRAMEMAQSYGRTEIAKQIGVHLKSYQAKHPYRE
jgi:tetratricopeptide (TPR) repeat protein